MSFVNSALNDLSATSISFSRKTAVKDFVLRSMSISALLVTDMKPDKCKYVGNVNVTFILQKYCRLLVAMLTAVSVV
jgi:hypothetical protein